jgi:pimeloyl-ACP methyl ester carboxylesterase
MSTSYPPMGRLIDIGGRRLAIYRSGEGGPTVVFAPGAGLIGLDYLNVQQAVSDFARAVIYDRAATGWSDPVALPRTAAAVAEELRALLAVADLPPPYVLVGHSLGGAYIRRFAQLFPGDVAGLLFLDPAHEGYASFPRASLMDQLRIIPGLLRAAVNMKRFYRPMFERMFAAWPDPPRGPLIDYHLRHWRRSLDEAKGLQTEVFRDISQGGPLPDVPVIVLTAMGVDPFMAAFSPEAALLEINQRKLLIYQAFAACQAHGEHRAIAGAGHSTMHTDRPDAVVGAIHDLVDAANVTPAASLPLASG